ncbi:MAG TPA: hypothetical protein VNA20_02500 [Frankiaceae bacterium]|nr:hypothetical protein [Frankiaceae bacterium]
MNAREDRQGGTPRRRALGRRSRPEARTDSERIAAVAAEHDVPVEDVLREVADFRLALETDMIIAAAAVDADSPEVLSEVLDGERLELASFHDRLLERLADAAADDELASRRAARARQPRRVGRAAGYVAAAAVALAILGVGRGVVAPTDMRAASNAAAMETADQHYADFSSAVTSDSPAAVREAAQQLHRTLQRLINDHASDPEVAQRAAQLLQAEISLLRATDPDGASQVLAQARSLVTMLERKAPPKVRNAVQPVLDAAAVPSETAKPPKKAKPSPSATPSPKSTSSPRSSSSPSGSPAPGPLDTP